MFPPWFLPAIQVAYQFSELHFYWYFFFSGFYIWTLLLYSFKTQLFSLFQTFLFVTESIDGGNCWIKLNLQFFVFVVIWHYLKYVLSELLSWHNWSVCWLLIWYYFRLKLKKDYVVSCVIFSHFNDVHVLWQLIINFQINSLLCLNLLEHVKEMLFGACSLRL